MLHPALRAKSLHFTQQLLAKLPRKPPNRSGLAISARKHRGKTALHLVVTVHHELLLQNGLDLNIEDNSGHAALLYAAENRFSAATKTLLECHVIGSLETFRTFVEGGDAHESAFYFLVDSGT